MPGILLSWSPSAIHIHLYGDTRPTWRTYAVTGERMGWRDPFVVRDDESDGWVMVVCAQDASRPVQTSGCVAWANSDDLEHWTVHPPLIAPGDVDLLECPILERLNDGTWLLIGSIGATRGFEARTAPRLRGPWTRRGPLGPTGSYAPRVIAAPDGSRVVLHTTPRRVGLIDTGECCRGMLAQPKLLVAPPGEAPRLEWARPGRMAWRADRPAHPARGRRRSRLRSRRSHPAHP